mmetsp:Transcript_20987/g.39681  ORF Transcript_20987/g.39681 Transcript_20987/m.39681 type:complete len:450 (-) Transcript_20987:247-1596(-)
MLASSSGSMRLLGLVVSASKSHCKYTSSIRNVRHQTTTTNPAAAPVRQAVTKEERAARRAVRKERANAFMYGMSAAEGTAEGATAAAGNQAQKATASSSGPMFDATRLGWYAAVLIPTGFIGWGIVDSESPAAKLSRMIGLADKIEEFSKPARVKLLPDWNTIPNIPPNFPAPPTLVIDLEHTLVSSTWDRRYGWRHAKRPGVDKFLATMAQYYEIVLFTPSPDGLAQPVLDSLDSNGYAMHRLFRDSTSYHDGVHCKDLSWLNRPVGKIIALDDDPAALQFQPDNLIRVKPYDNPDLEDNTLERITPLLVEISREQYDDIPGLLRQFKGMDADEIADEQERRVNEIRVRNNQITQRGLGSFASSRRSLPPPELPSNMPGSGDGQPKQLTAKDLVGDAPPSETSESGVMGWLQRRQKQQEEQNKEKFGLWNEVMMKKQADKQKQLEEQQ